MKRIAIISRIKSDLTPVSAVTAFSGPHVHVACPSRLLVIGALVNSSMELARVLVRTRVEHVAHMAGHMVEQPRSEAARWAAARPLLAAPADASAASRDRS